MSTEPTTIISDSKRIYWAQSTILQMLDFWSSAVRIKKWLGYLNLKQIYGSLTPQTNAYEIRKTICEYSEKKNVIFINWYGSKTCYDHSELIFGDEVHIVLKFFEENKLALYAIDLNKELCRIIFTSRRCEIGGNGISPYKISLTKKSNSKGSFGLIFFLRGFFGRC